MANTIKVAIAGINGKMGRASASAILSEPDLELTAACGRAGAGYVGKDLSELTHTPEGKRTGISVSHDLSRCLEAGKPDVLLDFTVAEPAIENAEYALNHGVRPVIGVSGISVLQIEKLTKLAADKKLGAMIVPNFSIGAVLMMEFSRQAAKYFSNVEIVEMHHTRKLDAPSGTAMYTARKLAQLEKQFNPREVEDKELLQGSRGGLHESGVRVHSLRLPGLISHQDVIFGSDGELLSIRHDSFNTNCFMKGIVMSLKSVMQMNSLVVGLENILS